MTSVLAYTISPHLKCIEKIQKDFNISEEQAQMVWNLGDESGNKCKIGEHRFYSGIRNPPFGDEYYIPVFGPNGLICSRYHYED
jgi:hypothetical protein